MTISLIVAYDNNRGIGKAGGMPWAGKIPHDMAHFRELTLGHPVIMGRKTAESMGKALPRRLNIVLTRDHRWHMPEFFSVGSLAGAIEFAEKHGEEIFVIGGSEIYREMLPYADRMYITLIDGAFECDTFFPEFNLKEWDEKKPEIFVPDEKNIYKLSFHTLKRKTA